MKFDSNDKVLLTLAGKVWGFRRRVLAALVLLIVAKLAAVSVPIVLKQIVDALGEPEMLAALPVVLLVGYALLRFASTLFNEFRDLIFVRVSQSTVAEYTERIFRHLHALGARFHANRATGSLTRDVERGTASIGFLLNVALFTIVPTVVEISIIVAILTGGYSVGYALIIAGTFLLYAAFSVVFTKKRAIRQRRVNELDSNAHRRLVDSMLNHDTVKLYTNEAFEARRFGSIMGDWIEAGISNQKALTRLHIGQSGIIALGVAAVMLLAGREVFAGAMTVGDLVLINSYVIQICLPLNSLGFVFREATDAMVKAERLFELFRERPEVEPEEERAELTVDGADVRFDGVEFGYEPSRQVLHGIDLRIPSNSKVAVVGGSGSGKSTLAKLLLGFYAPWSGRVLIDGQDLAGLSPDSVRGAIGVVPQDTSLFNETIAYNIAYGRIDATREEVVAAAKAANVHEFISALPEGYDTLVGERGVKLSGGEKQRVAIARAMLKNPPILVLDEATSALDMRSERAIQAELNRLASRRTTLVIAHRLATVVDADEILVLEAGRIVERGRHEELLAHDGLYAQMWSLQEQEQALRRSERRAVHQPVSLSALITGAVDAVRAEIEAKGVNLYTTLGLEAGLVTGDPAALQQVAWDLLAHVVRVSETGERVEVGLERAGNEILLRVAGTGGADDGGSAELAELSAIVDDHDGRLTVERAEEVTTYTAALPVRAVAAPVDDAARLETETAGGGVSLAGRRLLIVDDDEDARETLGELLRAREAEVESVGDGRAALEYLRSRSSRRWPDLMVCDIGLPEEDGYRLLRRVRTLEAEQALPLAERMPAIALTGYARPEDRVQALVAGYQAHLAKPAAPETLFATIARLLESGRAALDEARAG